MLRFTSCLFGTVVVHAYYRRLEVYHHLFLLVTILSILYHCTHQRHVARLDKGVAHACFVFILRDTYTACEKGALWLLLFPLSVLVCWFGQSFAPSASDKLHAALHILTVAGLHCYLRVLY